MEPYRHVNSCDVLTSWILDKDTTKPTGHTYAHSPRPVKYFGNMAQASKFSRGYIAFLHSQTFANSHFHFLITVVSATSYMKFQRLKRVVHQRGVILQHPNATPTGHTPLPHSTTWAGGWQAHCQPRPPAAHLSLTVACRPSTHGPP